MALNSVELERLADDMYRDRRITGSVYCGRCGYNLKTLPYLYICPECGNQYNARPLKMKGIFSPHEMSIPFRDMLTTVFFAGVTALFAYSGAQARDPFRFFVGMPGAVVTLVYGYLSCSRLLRFFEVRAIARRIAIEEADE